MKLIKADGLSFPLASEWAEVTIGQFVQLADPDIDSSTEHVITTLTGLTAAQFRPLRAYDLDAVVSDHLKYLKDTPTPTTPLPRQLVIGGKDVKIPTSLGGSSTVGMMWDIQFEINSRQKQQQPADSVTLAPLLLTVFLWSTLRPGEPYPGHRSAYELWDDVGKISCLDGLALSAFFLTNFMTPLPSGRISVENISPTHPSKWHERLRRACKRLTPISWRSN